MKVILSATVVGWVALCALALGIAAAQVALPNPDLDLQQPEGSSACGAGTIGNLTLWNDGKLLVYTNTTKVPQQILSYQISLSVECGVHIVFGVVEQTGCDALAGPYGLEGGEGVLQTTTVTIDLVTGDFTPTVPGVSFGPSFGPMLCPELPAGGRLAVELFPGTEMSRHLFKPWSGAPTVPVTLSGVAKPVSFGFSKAVATLTTHTIE